jgi:DNA sulfur modification protein DndD
MLLQKIIFKNFRQFEEAEIKFNNREDKHVSVIFGANGSGKTTILSGIVWALYGGKKIPYGEMTDQFLNKNIFNSLEEGQEKEVRVILTFEDKNKNYEINRYVKIKKINNQQRISIGPEVEVKINNKIQTFGQKHINEVLDENLSEYFFFDGENIGSLADSTNPKRVQNGIKNIMKISVLEEAVNLIKKVKKDFEKEAAQIQKEKGEIDESPESKILILEDEIELLKKELDKAYSDKAFLDNQIRDFEKQIKKIEEIEEQVKRKENLEKEKESLENQILNIENEIKKLIKDYGYIGISKELLEFGKSFIKDKEDKGELPIVGISVDFIESLLDKGECICGEKIEEGDEHYKNLKLLIKKAVSKSDLDKRIHNLHVFIDTYFNKPIWFKNELTKYRKQIELLEDELKKIASQLDEINSEIYDESKIGEGLKDKHFEYKQQKEEILKKIGNLETEIEYKETELKNLKKQLQEYQSQDEELNLIRKRINLCEKAIEFLENKKNIKMNEIREKLSNNLNKKFQEILRSNKTAKIDEDFRLVIEENGKISPKSRGESKLISLLFISCLIDLAKEEELNKTNDDIQIGAGIYPIVVDSPYGELDTEYKKSISEVLKQLAPQVVLLLNQSQWDKNIEEIFSPSLSNVYRLVAHRPKLKYLDKPRNSISFQGKSYELEIPDDKEFTTVERIL